MASLLLPARECAFQRASPSPVGGSCNEGLCTQTSRGLRTSGQLTPLVLRRTVTPATTALAQGPRRQLAAGRDHGFSQPVRYANDLHLVIGCSRRSVDKQPASMMPSDRNPPRARKRPSYTYRNCSDLIVDADSSSAPFQSLREGSEGGRACTDEHLMHSLRTLVGVHPKAARGRLRGVIVVPMGPTRSKKTNGRGSDRTPMGLLDNTPDAPWFLLQHRRTEICRSIVELMRAANASRWRSFRLLVWSGISRSSSGRSGLLHPPKANLKLRTSTMVGA